MCPRTTVHRAPDPGLSLFDLPPPLPFSVDAAHIVSMHNAERSGLKLKLRGRRKQAH